MEAAHYPIKFIRVRLANRNLIECLVTTQPHVVRFAGITSPTRMVVSNSSLDIAAFASPSQLDAKLSHVPPYCLLPAEVALIPPQEIAFAEG